MDIRPAIGLPAVIALVATNGFFVAAEFAMVAARRSRLEQLANEGHRGAQSALDVIAHLDAYIAACQLGITMASLGLGWIGEPALAHLLEPLLVPYLGTRGVAAANGVAVAISFSLITALHIVIGELAPKGLALQYPEVTTLRVTRPLRVFHRVFRWPIVLLNGIGNAVLRPFGVKPSGGHAMVHSAEELQLLVTASEAGGTVEPSEARIASRAFQFADVTAGELMTPRMDIEAVPVTITWPEILAFAEKTRYDRLPVYRESLDDVIGLLHARDLFPVIRTGQFDLPRLLHPCPAVPRTQTADVLLEEMQATGNELVIVIDEYGGTAGLVTMADLMEALVGRTEAGHRKLIGPVEADGSRVFDGLVRVAEFEEATEIRFGEDDRNQAATIGGVIMARLGHVPQVGDEVEIGGWRVRVEEVRRHRVRKARLLPPAPDQGSPSQN
jgi:CBS domain containing-hemolysin-like protein